MTAKASTAMEPSPAYDELLRLGDDPRSRASWDHFGRTDGLGAFNRLSEEAVRDACAGVRHGRVFSLNWAVELPDPPLFSRGSVRRTAALDLGYADDKLDDFHLQGSTQWDSLTHVCHPDHGFYNDPPRDEHGLVRPEHGGMHLWARRGLAGRFVLADVERWRREQGRPIDPTGGEQIPLADLVGTLDAQRVVLAPGDVLLLRFGWVGWYETADAPQRAALAADPQPKAPGLAASTDVVRWMWESGIAAVAADNPGVEALPADPGPYDSLHFTVLPLLGITFGELFMLDHLAADCAADGVFTGLFTSAPLNVLGGVGSPANALCIK